MTLLLNFITAIAWIWGVICLFGVIVMLIPPMSDKDADNAGAYIALGVIPWAWLMARYLL